MTEGGFPSPSKISTIPWKEITEEEGTDSICYMKLSNFHGFTVFFIKIITILLF